MPENSFNGGAGHSKRLPCTADDQPRTEVGGHRVEAAKRDDPRSLRRTACVIAIDQASHPRSLPSDVDVMGPGPHTGVNDCVAANAEWSGCIEKDARARRYHIKSRLTSSRPPQQPAV